MWISWLYTCEANNKLSSCCFDFYLLNTSERFLRMLKNFLQGHTVVKTMTILNFVSYQNICIILLDRTFKHIWSSENYNFIITLSLSWFYFKQGPSWSWLYGSCIYNYLCNQCLSPLKFRVRTPFMVRCARYNIMW